MLPLCSRHECWLRGLGTVHKMALEQAGKLQKAMSLSSGKVQTPRC
jgi:hypothetical protein